jgi:hypothetical protein
MLKDGGDDMVLKLNGNTVCDSKAVYEAAAVGEAPKQGTMSGMLSDMTMCLKHIDVKKGDILTMEANYDSEKHAE